MGYGLGVAGSTNRSLVLTTCAPGHVVRDGLDVLAVQGVPEEVGRTVAAVPLVGAVVAVGLAVAVQLLGDAEPGVVAQEVAHATGVHRLGLVVVAQVGLAGQGGQHGGGDTWGRVNIKCASPVSRRPPVYLSVFRVANFITIPGGYQISRVAAIRGKLFGCQGLDCETELIVKIRGQKEDREIETFLGFMETN